MSLRLWLLPFFVCVSVSVCAGLYMRWGCVKRLNVSEIKNEFLENFEIFSEGQRGKKKKKNQNV